MNCKNILNNILFSLLYLYGLLWLIISISPKIRKNLTDYHLLKKEISIELLISMVLINKLSACFYFFEKIFDGNHNYTNYTMFDRYNIEELKRIRQLYLIVGFYVINIHIVYIIWILVFVIIYLYANIWLFFSEIISKKELESHLNNNNIQSQPIQIDIESDNVISHTTQIIGIPIDQPNNQQYNQQSDQL